jgi:RNA polymerase primary sigma factor
MLALPSPPARLALPWPPPDPRQYEGLVVSIARRYRGLGLPLDDLISEGQCGLLNACKLFDRSWGVEFMTYATPAIRFAIVNAIAAQAGPIRIPRDLRAAIARGETPDRPGRLRAAIAVAGLQPRDADVARVADRDRGPCAPGADAAALPWEWLRELVGPAVASLPTRTAEIVRMRYGLGGHAPMELHAIGRAMGITKERVRQIVQAALAKLRGRFLAILEREGEAMGLSKKQCEALGIGKLFPAPEPKAGRRRAAHPRGVMNRTEDRYAEALEAQRLLGEIKAWSFEPDTLRLAPDMTYTPDFRVEPIDNSQLIYVDIKGKHIWEDATVKIKAAAVLYPQHRFQQVRWDGWKWTVREFPAGHRPPGKGEETTC